MRRRFVKPVVFLLLGAMSNAAVAWGCTWISLPSTITEANLNAFVADLNSRTHSQDATVDERSRLHRFGWIERQRIEKYGYGIEKRTIESFGALETSFVEVCRTAPGSFNCSWGRRDPTICNQICAGFPVRSMCGERWQLQRDTFGDQVNTSIEARSRYQNVAAISALHKIDVAGLSEQFGMIFPLRPVCPGFAINTIFYAAILWLLVATPGLVRRRIRARRGQCPTCAYPIGSSTVCIECGKSVRAISDRKVITS